MKEEKKHTIRTRLSERFAPVAVAVTSPYFHATREQKSLMFPGKNPGPVTMLSAIHHSRKAGLRQRGIY